MKCKGGLPPGLAKIHRVDPNKKINPTEMYSKYSQAVDKYYSDLEKNKKVQKEKTGLSQFVKPKSPFTGPGPATAGRKRYRKSRRTRRRKH